MNRAKDLAGLLRFLTILLPYILSGIAIRLAGDRFQVRFAWGGLVLGTPLLLAEAWIANAHDGQPGTLIALLPVGVCGFRLLVANPSPSEGTGFPYGRLSSLVYYFHLFPLMILGMATHHRIGSVPLFFLGLIAIAAMIFVADRTGYSKRLA